MTIYEVLSEENGEKYSTKRQLLPEVKLALSDQFGKGASQYDDVKAKFGNFKNFVDKVMDVLLKLDCDESWLGEAYLEIENLGQDLLDGNEVGSHKEMLEDILGTDEAGTLNRVHGALF